MSNSLQGHINEDTLSSLLQFLAMNHNTGCLKLKQNAASPTGDVFFDGGQIIHAHYADMTGVAALAYFLTWKTGRFIFRNGTTTNQRTIHISLESALLEAAYHADINAQEMITPRLDINTTLKTRSLKEHTLVSLSFGALNLLRELDGKRTLAEIANEMGWSHDRVLQAGRELVAQELVTLNSEVTVSSTIMDALRKALVYMMGPIGEFVLDDALSVAGLEFHEGKNETISEPQVREVIQEVYSQLDQPNWREHFTSQAKQICQDYGISYSHEP